MKFSQIFGLACLVAVQSVALSHELSADTIPAVSSTADYGTVGFAAANPALWYTVTTRTFPETVTISSQCNKGFSHGGLDEASTGLTILEGGNYWITISATFQNPGPDGVMIPVFLARNEVINLANPEISGVAVVEPGMIRSLTATGIAKDIQPGTVLSLVAANGGNPAPKDVKVVGWSVSLFKLPN